MGERKYSAHFPWCIWLRPMEHTPAHLRIGLPFIYNLNLIKKFIVLPFFFDKICSQQEIGSINPGCMYVTSQTPRDFVLYRVQDDTAHTHTRAYTHARTHTQKCVTWHKVSMGLLLHSLHVTLEEKGPRFVPKRVQFILFQTFCNDTYFLDNYPNIFVRSVGVLISNSHS